MTNKPRKIKVSFWDCFFLVISGMGIGWLIGLSASPVIHIVVGSVIALVAGVVGALAGLDVEPSETSAKAEAAGNGNALNSRKRREKLGSLPKINPLPLTALVAGLVAGSCVGVYARSNDWLGANPQRLVRKWSGIGLDDKEIKKRLFDQLYPPTASFDSPESVAAHSQLPGVVYSLAVEDCELLQIRHGKELRTRLTAFGDRRIDAAVAKCKDDACLEAVKVLICSDAK